MARYLIDASKSRVSIEARSSLHPIHTETVGLEGWLDLDVRDGRIQVDGARGHVEFPVVKLKSGNAFEDKELQRRIDARRFPIISGELEFIRENGASGHLVGGALTFRGVTQRYEDHVTIGVQDDSTVTVVGQSVFDIRDFKMDPPRLLMLKVHPEVTVRIDVVADRQPESDGPESDGKA